MFLGLSNEKESFFCQTALNNCEEIKVEFRRNRAEVGASIFWRFPRETGEAIFFLPQQPYTNVPFLEADYIV